jgi:hypothetical protein
MSDNLETAETRVEEPLERFIPIGRQEIVADLINASHWTADEQKQFEEFCQIFTALYHYKFYAHLEELKRCYTPFNPDSDMVTQQELGDEEKEKRRQTVVHEISQLLNNANYEELTIDAINRAINAESYYGVRVSVDLDDFEKLMVFYRGSSTKVEYKRTWTSLFLLKEAIEIPIYKRLFLLLKFKTEQQRVDELVNLNGPEFEKKARKLVRNSRKNLPEDIIDEHVFLKLFKNIPRTDLEMLFPNQDVRLKLVDKIKLAVSGGGGTIFGIFGIIGKIGAAVINPFALIGAFFGLIGIIVRQILAIFTHRDKYMMVLSRNLYFHNLDNNFGVASYLIDMAEEEEGKEAILAYYFLLTHADKQYTQEELDRAIEAYIKAQYGVKIDFEVDDGLRKLRNEGILIEEADGKLKVLDLHQASACLDKQWDHFFNPDEKQ